MCKFKNFGNIMKQLYFIVFGISIIAVLPVTAQHFNTKIEASSAFNNKHLGNALWIGTQKTLGLTDSLLFETDPAPVFRKEFVAENNIRSAILYISAAGYYRSLLNGNRIGKNYLDPAWTNFSKRIYYSVYDLTKTIHKGTNCLAVTLGKGFYDPLPMVMFGKYNLRKALTTGKPVFIACLKLEYNNGKTTEIVTDNSWKWTDGPIQKNNVYLGEFYDANKETAGWATVGFKDDAWKQASQFEGPGGSLHKAFFPAVQARDNITPVSVTALQQSKWLVDMGVNFTGLYRIHLKGKPGDTITFRFGERIYPNGELNPMTTVAGQIKWANGGPGAPAIAWQSDRYIFGANTDVWYNPEFTFHTYRYMEIAGLAVKPDITDIEGISLNTNVENIGHFASSNELINKIQQITERTFLANLVSVQSDCPAREKFGYGGDLNATREAFIYNYDMHQFYRKTVYDWLDAMNDSIFVDTAPYIGLNYCGLSWESAFLITQYDLLLYYKDSAIIKELYNTNLAWMKKAERIHPDGIVDKGLSDHEALEPVPVELTGTAHYLQCARIMKKFSAIMGDGLHEQQFDELANKLQTKILNKFWRQAPPEPVNKQTLFATLLYYDIIPAAEAARATDSLLKTVVTQEKHFTTGIFGTKYILEALSKTGNAEAVYKIVNSRAYPGWGHMIDQGATTIWETWKESDDIYSNCHPMFGSISEWFYRWLGGIRPNQDYPGFEKFFISPYLPEGLSNVSVTYRSPFGEIISCWKNYGNNKQVFEITIPRGSHALVTLPVTAQQKIIFSKNSNGRVFSPNRTDKKHVSFELPAGKYTISIHL
jgi:alpha-L-rhamnosidase